MKTYSGFVYDEQMTKHHNAQDPKHPEGPHRVITAHRLLRESGLLNDCCIIKSRLATDQELALVHDVDYIAQVKGSGCGLDKPCKIPEKWPTYVSEWVYEASACAVGCVLNMVDAVCSKQVKNGIALVRPPGHHAEINASCGFCFFNNLSIAARYARQTYGINKVLILDWDIHHGNGIQHVFYNDPSVLYISLHRYDNGDYFPYLKESSVNAIGSEEGKGYTVNIPWNKDLMGNAEYKGAFDRIVMPIAEQFNPDLVLVAAGFDAAAADPLGEYILTPDMYGYMTQRLQTLAEGRVLLALEGGYNGHAVGEALIKCLEVLQGKLTITDLKCGQPSKRALQTVEAVVKELSEYWAIT